MTAIILDFISPQRRIALGFVKLEQPRYDLGNDLRDRGEANHGAARPFITDLRPRDWTEPQK
jgi:hypothetical protein